MVQPADLARMIHSAMTSERSSRYRFGAVYTLLPMVALMCVCVGIFSVAEVVTHGKSHLGLLLLPMAGVPVVWKVLQVRSRNYFELDRSTATIRLRCGDTVSEFEATEAILSIPKLELGTWVKSVTLGDKKRVTKCKLFTSGLLTPNLSRLSRDAESMGVQIVML